MWQKALKQVNSQRHRHACSPAPGHRTAVPASRGKSYLLHSLLFCSCHLRADSPSRVQFFMTPWTMACQAPLSMGFSRQEHCRGLPFSSPAIKYEVSEVSEVKLLSCVRLFATPWIVAYQAPASMGFSRQEYWSGLPFLFPSFINSIYLFYLINNVFSISLTRI